MNNLNYGIIGNCRTAALISEAGSIDWLCMPDFDSPSVFAKILDNDKGGEFSIHVNDSYKISQHYLDRTNILITKFSNNVDAFEVIDFMPRYKTEDGLYYNAPEIYRYIRYISGSPTVRFRYKPALNYAITPTTTVKNSKFIKSYNLKGAYDSIYLYTDFDFEDLLNENDIVIKKNGFFLISYNQKLIKIDIQRVYLEYQRTKVYWMNWVNRTTIFPLYQYEIIRSALVLKLLTYNRTGAILAAATTSLPEIIGESRNWDYRYCWIRDTSMVIETLLRMNHVGTAQDFFRFLLNIITDKDEDLQIMYGIRGEKKLPEKVLNHLSGYKNSKPVRIGNAAYLQKQHDIYGILMDVILKSFQTFPQTLDTCEELWTIVRGIVRIVENNWFKPDRGIWEIRREQKHFVISKVLSWVAIDRAVRLAELFSNHDLAMQWRKVGDKIKNDVMVNGWNNKIKSFTQSYGDNYMDAANLLMEKYGFIEADNPMYISTVMRIKKELLRNGLMYRYYNHDGFGIPKNSFTICTFWMIEALYKIGHKEEARELFFNLMKYSNHLGLYSEGIDMETGELLGNFPQAYSHLALVQTAILLNENIEKETQVQFIKP